MIDDPFEEEPADGPKKDFADALKKADLVVVRTGQRGTPAHVAGS